MDIYRGNVETAVKTIQEKESKIKNYSLYSKTFKTGLFQVGHITFSSNKLFYF